MSAAGPVSFQTLKKPRARLKQTPAGGQPLDRKASLVEAAHEQGASLHPDLVKAMGLADAQPARSSAVAADVKCADSDDDADSV